MYIINLVYKYQINYITIFITIMILKQRKAFHCQQQQTHKMKKNQKQNTTKITTNAQRENERTQKLLKNHKTNFTEKGGMLSHRLLFIEACVSMTSVRNYIGRLARICFFLSDSSTESFNTIFYSKL